MAVVKSKLRGCFARSLWAGEGAEEDTRGRQNSHILLIGVTEPKSKTFFFEDGTLREPPCVCVSKY